MPGVAGTAAGRAGPRKPPSPTRHTPPARASQNASAQSTTLAPQSQVLDSYPRLDVLVNNVGGFWAHRHLTADGLERTFALNRLAPFLLTSLLVDRLTAGAPARIVTVFRRPRPGAASTSMICGASGTTPPSADQPVLGAQIRWFWACGDAAGGWL